MFRVTDPDGRTEWSRYSDEDVLKEAARLSKSTGNRKGPIPKNAASIARWIRWNDPDADVRHLRTADMADAMYALRQYLTDADMADAGRQNPGGRARKRNTRNPSIGDYLRAGKKAALSAAETAASEAKAATERVRKAAAEEYEARKVDSPEKALRVLAAAHGYDLVKKNPRCTCGGKCAPCASRKSRRRKVAR